MFTDKWNSYIPKLLLCTSAAVAIMIKRKFKVVDLSNSCKRNVAMMLSSGCLKVGFVYTYLQSETGDGMRTMNRGIEKLNGFNSGIVLGMDCNRHHPDWG